MHQKKYSWIVTAHYKRFCIEIIFTIIRVFVFNVKQNVKGWKSVFSVKINPLDIKVLFNIFGEFTIIPVARIQQMIN